MELIKKISNMTSRQVWAGVVLTFLSLHLTNGHLYHFCSSLLIEDYKCKNIANSEQQHRVVARVGKSHDQCSTELES